MKPDLKNPKKGAGQRLRDLYQKLRNESRRPEEDKPKTSQTDKKSARPSSDSDLEI